MGLTVPHTWEELVTLVQQVNDYNEAHGTEYAAIELGDKDSWLGELLYTMIVNRIDPYAQEKLASGEMDFSDPVFSDAAAKLMQLKDMNAFPEKFLEIGEVEAVQDFADGKAVLFPHQSTIVYHLLDEMGACLLYTSRPQYRIVSGECVDKGASGRGQHADTDDRTDHWRCGEYCTGSVSDLRIMRSAENGNRRSCHRHRGGTDCGSSHRYEGRLPENTKTCGIPTSDQTDLQAWNPQHSDAVGLHVLHIWTESDPCDLLGSGGDGTGIIL